MKLYWTIGGLPELGSLSDDARRALLRRVAGWRAYAMLLGKAAFFGLLIAQVALWLLPDGIVAAYGALATFAIASLLVYQFNLLHLRAALRLQLKRAFAGERLPVCIECGYDTRGLTVGRGPECGAALRPRGPRT